MRGRFDAAGIRENESFEARRLRPTQPGNPESGTWSQVPPGHTVGRSFPLDRWFSPTKVRPRTLPCVVGPMIELAYNPSLHLLCARASGKQVAAENEKLVAAIAQLDRDG